MTIAVDFDGTITEQNLYPDVGPFRAYAVNVLKALQQKGHTICLWTCRHGETLDLALLNLKKKGFTPDYVNEGPFSTGSPKMVANVYIDDAAWPKVCMPERLRVDWYEIGKSFQLSEDEINGNW